MAETNTYTIDNSPQTETLSDNLTPDEQDSLAVGEGLVEQQEQLLAGKYKVAAELEKAYVELQKKLGSKGEPTEDVEQASATADPFLDVDFASLVDQTGTGMGSSAPTNLSDAQRVALAGGDLDEAIALGSSRV